MFRVVRYFFTIFFVFAIVKQGKSQIITFEFATLTGDEVTANSNTNDANLTSSTISRGAGLTATANADRFNATSWALTSIANAVTGNDYMEFTVTPNLGYQFTVSSIQIQLQRSSTGPSAIALRNSLDNYGSNLDQEYAIVDGTTTQTFTFTFTQTASSSAVTYRIYSYAESTAGSGGIGDFVGGNDIIVNGVVSSANDSDSEVQTSAVLTEPATISSLDDSNTEWVDVFDFTLSDLGTADGLSTILDELVITQGSANNVANWSNAIAGARLNGSDVTNLAGTISATGITFSGADFISIADGGTETYTLSIFLKTDLSNINDNDNLEFKMAFGDITEDASGSSFGVGTIESGDANVAIDINATTLSYSSIPSSALNSTNFTVSVEAVDVNGNRDLDETSSITLALASGIGTLSSVTGLTQNLSAGIYMWTDVQHNTDETITIEAQCASLTNVTSSNIVISTPNCDLYDDFNRVDNTTIGNGWTEVGGNSSITSNELIIGTGGASGVDYIHQDISSSYIPTLDNLPGIITWKFNMRHTRTDPSGLASGNYGTAFILGGTSSDFTIGSGYAVVHGNTGTTDNVKLVAYNNGVDGTLTDIVISAGDYGNEHFSIKVTFDPSTNTWELFFRDDVGSFADPSTLAAGNSEGSAVNSTYIATSTPYSGCYFAHATGASEQAEFDNICTEAPVCSAPTTNASGATISNIGTTSLDINWTSGNGNQRIVVIKQGSAVDFIPADNTTYSADNDYSSSTDLGSGNKVIYNGTGNSVSVLGLTPGTDIFIKIYEYNCSDGFEVYKTDGVFSTATDITIPFNVSNLTTVCKTTTEISLEWNLPTGNFDGVMVFCRLTTVPLDPDQDASAYTGANSDFSSASDYGTRGKLVYSGAAGTSLTITNLTPGSTYKIETYSYRDAAGTTWSSGTGTSQVAALTEASNFISTTGNISLGLSWTNPNGSCFDEVLIVAKSGSAVTTAPTGDGSAYSAVAAFGSGTDLGGSEFVVYQGTGTYVNVTGLTNGTTYHFEIFVRKGTTWSNGITSTGTPDDISVFRSGDVVIVGFDTYAAGDGSDKLIFTNFVEIQPNTEIIFANAVWEYKAAANERTYKWYSGNGNFSVDVPYFTIKYVGASNLAVGSIMCMTISSAGGFGSILIDGGASADWVDNGDAGTFVQFSSSNPDAVWMMQGTLTTGLTDDDGDQYGVLNGKVLGGIQSRGTFQDFSVAGNNGGSRVSRIHPDISCLGISTGGSSGAYYGEYSAAADHNNSQTVLLSAISNTGANWNLTAGGDNVDNLTVCSNTFNVTTGFTAGLWKGTTDDDWFNCGNWDDFQVPSAQTEVKITQTGTNNCVIGGGQEAEALSISITSNSGTNNILGIEAASSLTVGEDINIHKTGGAGTLSISVTGASTITCENLSITGSAGGANDALFVNEVAANSITVNGNINIESGGKIDLDGAADEGVITLKGNWTNNETAETGFDEGTSTLIFSGGSQQSINTNGFEEQFANFTVNKALGGDITIADNVEIKNTLTLTDGVITTGSNILEVSDNTFSSIAGFSNISFINGNLRKHILNNGNTYPLPVGYGGTATTNYYRVDFINSGTAGITYLDANVSNITETGNNIDSRLGASAYQAGTKINNIFEGAIWTITPDVAGTPNYGVNLYIANVSGPVDNKFTVLKRPDGSTDYADWSTFEGSTTIPVAGDPGRTVASGYAQRLGFTSFSGFGGGGGQWPLPIKLLEFTGNLIDNNTHLKWTTATEINNDYFSVERSINSKYFYQIATVAGAGNSNIELDYFITDNNPMLNITNYYRLKQVDFDGKYSYSNTIAVNPDNENNEDLFITKFNDNQILINSGNNKNIVQFINSLGQVIKTIIVQNGLTILHLEEHLTTGIYFIKVSNTETVKVLKVQL